jgi:hypothetical protein
MAEIIFIVGAQLNFSLDHGKKTRADFVTSYILKIYHLVPDPDLGHKCNADPCGSGSESLPEGLTFHRS